MKRAVLLGIVAVGALVAFSAFFWLYQTQYLVGRASVTQYSFSVDNSYVFVSPLQAQANGQERVRVTVFILNNQGLGVAGKKVLLGSDPGLAIEAVQGVSDLTGKAIFDATSKQAGEYYLDIKVDDIVLPQKAHVSFK
jgi:hypothetical protein